MNIFEEDDFVTPEKFNSANTLVSANPFEKPNGLSTKEESLETAESLTQSATSTTEVPTEVPTEGEPRQNPALALGELPPSATEYSTATKVKTIGTAVMEPFRALGEWTATKTTNLGYSAYPTPPTT